MTIVFCGGGTMGPVTPLIAVLRQMKRLRPDTEFAWAGTPEGPEREVIRQEGIRYFAIPVAKLPRFFSLEWFTWPLSFFKARKASERMIRELRPSLVVSAGGFTSVPVMRVASRLNIPCAIHQLDVVPGLSNRVVASFCRSITTSFSYEDRPFVDVKTERVPTPCRTAGKPVRSKNEAAATFGLSAARPILFVVGGGTGAQAINEIVWSALDELLDIAEVIHVTGKGKFRGGPVRAGYSVHEFLDEDSMQQAYAASDLVISRAGMGSLSELANLKKAAIIIPIPRSHQEENAKHMPFPVIQQSDGTRGHLLELTRTLLANKERRKQLATAATQALPTDDGTALAQKWLGLLA